MEKPFLSSTALIMGLVLCCAAVVHAEKGETATGTVTGIIGIKSGGPMMNGTIFFVDEKSGPPPSATRYWRVPTHAFRINEQAQFTAVLPEGTYFVGAIERKSGETLGPPQEGDYFFISLDKKGNPKKLTVWKGSTIDLGMVVEAVPFRRETLEKKGITSIQGTIRDDSGKPREGIAVFAFTSPTMLGRPLFVSERSDKNGRYALRLADGGKYYLRARVNYGGGPPSADELMGVYKGGRPVVVTKGQTRKGADIMVTTPGM